MSEEAPSGALPNPPPDRPLFFGLLALVVWMPLPWGSNREWATGLFGAAVFGLAAVWLLLFAHDKVKLPRAFRHAWPVLLVFGMGVAWSSAQSLPLPIDWLAVLSPKAADVWRHAAMLDPAVSGAISIEPYRTELRAVLGLGYLLLFALVLLLARNRRRLRLLAYVIVASGVFQAFYGSAMTLSGAEYGFFWEKTTNQGVATGTFVNRNHLAGYLEMCLAVGVGLLLGSRFEAPLPNWRGLISQAAGLLLSSKLPLRIGIVVMAIGLVLTRSRMGNMGFAVSLSVAGLLYLMLAQASRNSRGLLIVLCSSIAIVDMFFVGTHFGIDKVAERLQNTSVTEVSNRVDLFDYAWPYVVDYGLLGSGAGTFYSAFPPFSGPEINFFFDHVHDDYLEFLGEFGLPGVVPLALGALASTAVACGAMRKRHDGLMRGMGFSSVMGGVALGIHSSVDFNLQIPANAALYMILLAMGWVARYLHIAQRKRV